LNQGSPTPRASLIHAARNITRPNYFPIRDGTACEDRGKTPTRVPSASGPYATLKKLRRQGKLQTLEIKYNSRKKLVGKTLKDSFAFFLPPP
jgi:hypothetical protein